MKAGWDVRHIKEAWAHLAGATWQHDDAAACAAIAKHLAQALLLVLPDLGIRLELHGQGCVGSIVPAEVGCC